MGTSIGSRLSASLVVTDGSSTPRARWLMHRLCRRSGLCTQRAPRTNEAGFARRVIAATSFCGARPRTGRMLRSGSATVRCCAAPPPILLQPGASSRIAFTLALCLVWSVCSGMDGCTTWSAHTATRALFSPLGSCLLAHVFVLLWRVFCVARTTPPRSIVPSPPVNSSSPTFPWPCRAKVPTRTTCRRAICSPRATRADSRRQERMRMKRWMELIARGPPSRRVPTRRKIRSITRRRNDDER